ncbi:MAG: GNAT family N-acetyltransferase [Thermodesulfobacteriota bacterium]|nr:GNAT family N-acetyltransferase [Thermodesulfobacteriota bacterium]
MILIEETKISRVLKGYRNIKKVDVSLLEEILIRVGRLVTDFPEIEELDINPMIVKNGELMAVDARVVIKKSKITPPMHLVISSYPWCQEAFDATIDNEQFFIRPIRPSDAPLLIDHFNSLSAKSIYQRFFSHVKQLSKTMLIKFTQIDYDREIALIALMGKNDDQKIVGVARIIFEPNGEKGEFAVAVSDNWQGKGIGASLLNRCLKIAKKQGLKHVWGVIIPENTQMKKLGKKLGFDIKMMPGTSEYELHMDLAKLDQEV